MTQIIERPSWSGDAEPDEPPPAAAATATSVSMVQAINRALHDAIVYKLYRDGVAADAA